MVGYCTCLEIFCTELQPHVRASNITRSWRAAAPSVADAAGAAAPKRADLAQLKDDRKQLKQALKQASKRIKNEDAGGTGC